MNISQYNSNSTYQNALVATIVDGFVSPNISADQVQNLAVSAGSRRNRRYLISSSSQSIFASYEIAATSQFSSQAYSTQLLDFVDSGQFSASLRKNAVIFGTQGFLNATSQSITIGKSIIFKLLRQYTVRTYDTLDTTPASPTSSPPTSTSALSVGAIAAIAIGAFIFLGIIVFGIYYLIVKYNLITRDKQDNNTESGKTMLQLSTTHTFFDNPINRKNESS